MRRVDGADQDRRDPLANAMRLIDSTVKAKLGSKMAFCQSSQ